MSKVLCFGELLLRLSPELGQTWIDTHQMPVFVGGAELNVATALARWHQPVAYATAIPDHYLSKELSQHVAGLGIESRILFRGDRIGTYYLPQGADLKSAGVIYDRAHSSFAELRAGTIDWDELLDGIDWFHFTAISPALNENATRVCLEALQKASRKNITISVDLNYRAKLWQYGKTPSEVMPQLVEFCDVVMGNLWAEERMLGLELPHPLNDNKASYLEVSANTSCELRKRFPRCRTVANTFRFEEGEGIRYYATLDTETGFVVSEEKEASKIIDKVGSGDTFMAGLIYASLHGFADQEKIDFAASAAFGKLFVKGDATTQTVEDILKKKTYA